MDINNLPKSVAEMLKNKWFREEYKQEKEGPTVIDVSIAVGLGRVSSRGGAARRNALVSGTKMAPRHRDPPNM